jgi:tetratricopeptide (TPR) repeat protein
LLADFAIQREDYEEAKSEYRTAMALRPHDPEIMLLTIRMLETARETQQAQEEATRAATEFPLHVGLNLEAGELMLRSAGDAEAAVKYLEQAVHSDPKMVRARVDLADAYAQLNKLDDAIHEINQIAATDDDGALHYRLARWYRQAGHPEEAAAALKLCKKLKQQTIERGSFVSSERSVKEARDPLQ